MRCPICNKASDATHKPFCSARCKDVDLNRWFTGSYTVPVVEMDDLPDEENVPTAPSESTDN